MKTINLKKVRALERLESRQLFSAVAECNVENTDCNEIEDEENNEEEEREEATGSRWKWLSVASIKESVRDFAEYLVSSAAYIVGNILSYSGRQLMWISDVMEGWELKKNPLRAGAVSDQRRDSVDDLDGEPTEWVGRTFCVVGALLIAVAALVQ